MPILRVSIGQNDGFNLGHLKKCVMRNRGLAIPHDDIHQKARKLYCTMLMVACSIVEKVVIDFAFA